MSRKVTVAHRSGFDKTYRNSFTGNVGTLIPIFMDEVIPDTKVNLCINVAASLPPLVSDTYMNVRLRLEAFAVPHRLLYANFEDFFDDYERLLSSTDGAFDTRNFFEANGCVPLIQLTGSQDTESWYAEHIIPLCGPGSLLDYMDFNLEDDFGSEDDNFSINVLPLLAYHLIWQEWYRNPRVQRPAFAPEANQNLVNRGSDVSSPVFASSLPFVYCFFSDGSQPTIQAIPDDGGAFTTSPLAYLLADGTNILSLRQRNFELDYFTGAMAEPQQGPKAEVQIVDDKFSIESLRAQNSIQQFRERNNLTSPRYNQQIYARYGVTPSDAVIQRPVLIGAASYDVYSHGVTQTSATESEGFNPFSKFLGSRGGNAFAAGSDFIIHGFHAKEPMYIIVLASLVPDVTYSQGLNRIFMRYRGLGSITDMANHILQNVGPQPIFGYELVGYSGQEETFAWADRYADWMIKKNQLHGKFRYGQDLASFVLQRHFGGVPEYGSEFLEIPTNYLDGVMQVTSENMGFAYWLDSMIEYKCSQPIRAYSIPSLQDPAYEHGKSISLRNNGQLL